MIDRRAFFRGIAGAATISISGGSIVGCTNRPVGEDRNPNTVSLWGIWPSEAEAELKIIEAFSEVNPHVTVNVSQAPSNGMGDDSPIITAVRGGTVPDVWFMDRFKGAQFAALGLVEPIDALIEEYEMMNPEEFMSGWVRAATHELYFNGSWYGLPVDADTRALFYNKTLTDEAGLSPDLLDPANGPITIDHIWEISEKFDRRDKSGNYERLTWIPWDNQASLVMWAYAYRVAMYNESTCDVRLNSPEMLALATTYAEWVERLEFARVDAFTATYEPANAPPGQNAFFAGRQMFHITTPDEIANLQEFAPTLDYGVSHLPTVDENADPFTWAGGFGLAMPKGSSKSKAAWDLMKFYAGYEGQKILMPPFFRIPTNIQAIMDPQAWDRSISFFVEQMKYAHVRVPLPVGSMLSDAMFNMQESLNQSSKSPAEAVETAQRFVNPTMQQYCPVQLPEDFGAPDPVLVDGA